MQGNKLNIKKTILLSVGYFAASLAWSVYNAFLPQILEGFVKSTAAIGLVMTADNIFGAVFQPIFGRVSDKTRTRFGRRMPYLLVGIPVCAAAFIFIPQMTSLWSLMAVVMIFTFTMSAWRSPAMALIPDATPERLRSKANGIVDLMGGIGGVLAFAGGGVLFGLGGFPLPFLISAIFMLLSLLIMTLFVREPEEAYIPQDKAKKPDAKKLARSEKKSLVFLLLAVFFYFGSFNAIETFFTLYATNTLGMDSGAAAMTLSVFPMAFIAFAVPSGYLGARFGRRRVMMIGLIGFLSLALPMTFIVNIWLTRCMMLIGGVFWACIAINGMPMVVQFSGKDNVGAFVGYYYFFSFASQVISPILFGVIRDIFGHYRVLFAYASVPLLLAIICMFFVRHTYDETAAKKPLHKNEKGDVN